MTRQHRDMRGHRRYKTMRRQWLAAIPPHLRTCWICGRAVNYALPWPHPQSPTVDHTIETDRDEVSTLATWAWQLAHAGCNSTRGNHYRQARDRGETSRIRTSRPI
jgi:5-methylcytosine-specific restriction endonuclease McrA